MTANASKLGSIRFISWNIKGIHHPIKRTRVFTHLKSLGAEIMFLQETHLRTSDNSKLEKGWIGQMFCSKFDDRSRGTAILIKKGVPFVPTSVLADNNGRYVIVSGNLFGSKVVLANIYGPNWDNPQFFSRFIAKLPDLHTHYLILAGDWNLVQHPNLDRSRPRPGSTTSKSGKVVLSFMDSYKLSDPWRRANPTVNQYSYFSPVHHSFSRIDFFLVDSGSLPLVTNCQYHNIVISDHSPVQLDMRFPNSIAPQRTWRLDPLLLTSKDFVKLLNGHIDTFLSINSTPGMSSTTIWESLKAYLRGQIISYSAFVKKIRNQRITDLLAQMAELDKKYAVNPDPELYKERLLLQSEFDNLSIKQTEQLLFKSRQTFYEHGDKSGKLLAHQLKQAMASRAIPEIRVAPGETSTNPKIINDQFRQFYNNLYTSESTVDISEINDFLDRINIPVIDPQVQAEIDAALAPQEITQAINSMHSGKAAGPDGFPIEFYKACAEKLVPILGSVYEEAFTAKKLPETMTQANIAVLLKKDRDPLDCGSYRPISILCCDYKILTKILSRRLDTVIPKIIADDQTGFVPGRQSFYNVRRLFNVLYSSQSTQWPEAVLSVDTEKAFDRIEWRYLQTVLERFGFGPSFINWITLLYSAPKAAVLTNSTRSDYFNLQRSVRQGCSLSPYLFDIAIEPLAIALREDDRVAGIDRGGAIHKASLYADDLLVYISNPTQSIPPLIEILNHFGRLSGYKLNFSKSLFFPINQLALDLNYTNFPFKLELHSFTYLGISVTRSFKDLYEHNFKKLLDRTKLDLERWASLPVSLAGRVNSIKMTVLPRFLYIFQMIPLFLTKAFFRELNTYISAFIWNKARPRARKALLELPRALGGLGLPNFMFYYWAANIKKVSYWNAVFENSCGPIWACMEMSSDPQVSLISVLCSALPSGFPIRIHNPVINSTFKIWRQFRKHFGFTQMCGHMPLINNPLFAPSRDDSGHSAFKTWHDNGVPSFGELYRDGTFASFETLKRDYDLPTSHFFRFLQARSFAQEHFTFPIMTNKSVIDIILDWDSYTRCNISNIYEIIHSIDPPLLDKTKLAWEQDLGLELEEETWERSLDRIRTTSLCLRHGLIQFKILHRLHFSREKLSKIYPGVDSACIRCHLEPASIGHMFWRCSSLTPFWNSIFNVFSDLCNTSIEPNPITAIFGVPTDDTQVSSVQANVIAFSSLIARRLILRNWKSDKPPTFSSWVRDVLSFIPLEKLRYNRFKSKRKFKKVWSPFLSLVRTLTLEDPG